MTATPTSPAVPPIVDFATWQAARDELLPREKAHTREGDAIAAARRRLPMTEVPADTTFDGQDGQVTLIELFDGRQQLVIYKHMWHRGKPFEGQCPGCTATVWNFQDASYLRRRGISFAVVAEGPVDEIMPFREFMGYRVPWASGLGHHDEVFGDQYGVFLTFLRVDDRVYLTNWVTDRGTEVMMPSFGAMDMTVYGRQEAWEDSPDGWPQHPTFDGWMQDGRPTPQWTRLATGSQSSAS